MYVWYVLLISDFWLETVVFELWFIGAVVYDFLSISAGSSRGGVDFESLSQDLYGNIGKSRGRPLTQQYLNNVWGLVCLKKIGMI